MFPLDSLTIVFKVLKKLRIFLTSYKSSFNQLQIQYFAASLFKCCIFYCLQIIEKVVHSGSFPNFFFTTYRGLFDGLVSGKSIKVFIVLYSQSDITRYSHMDFRGKSISYCETTGTS